MPETTDPLVALRDVGVEIPTAADAGRERVRSALQREIAGRRRFRRRVRLPFGGRSVALMPAAAAVLVTVATAAAATTVALVNASPKTVFEHNPERTPGSAQRQTVIPSTIRRLATVAVPGFGPVQAWIGDTEQHGACWGLRAPSGWLTLAMDDRSGGSIPGCAPTRKQAVLAQGNSSVGLAPMSADYLSNAVKNHSGQWWDIYSGTVTANHATAVRDQNTDKIARLIAGRYFVLVERQTTNCEGCDNIRAINATGNVLPANYAPERYRDH